MKPTSKETHKANLEREKKHLCVQIYRQRIKISGHHATEVETYKKKRILEVEEERNEDRSIK